MFVKYLSLETKHSDIKGTQKMADRKNVTSANKPSNVAARRTSRKGPPQRRPVTSANKPKNVTARKTPKKIVHRGTPKPSAQPT